MKNRAPTITRALAQALDQSDPTALTRLGIWIPERSDADNIPAVVKTLFRLFGCRITDTTVDEQLPDMKAYPSLGAINRFLKRWSFTTRALRSTADRLSQIDYPVIAHLSEGRFVLLVGQRNDRVFYLDPRSGWRADSLVEFDAAWSGHILLSTPGAESREPGYDRRRRKELARRRADPRRRKVTLMDGFMSQEDCRTLIELAQADLHRSHVSLGSVESTTSPSRTSFSSTLPAEHPLIEQIRRRGAACLNVTARHCEEPTCQAYRPKQEFQVHKDAFGSGHPRRLGDRGDRLATLIVYLNADFVGGETYFPVLDVKIDPQVGRAAIWRNLDADDEVDPDSLHAGLSVFSGTKYALTMHIWNLPLDDWEHPSA